jgi:hypothetical protein
MRRTFRALVVVLMAVVTTPLLASPASARQPDRASGSLTANGCALTDSVTWRPLPPVYEIDTTLNRDGLPFIIAASVISYPQLGEPRLTSPQVIETFGMGSEVHTFTYTVTFVLKDRHGRMVASTTSPPVTVDCAFT